LLIFYFPFFIIIFLSFCFFLKFIYDFQLLLYALSIHAMKKTIAMP